VAKKIQKGERSERKKRAILLDFDHTLFDTDRFFWIDLRRQALRLGIPSQVWNDTYLELWREGYSLKKHFNLILKRLESAPPTLRLGLKILLNEFQWNLKRWVYPDVVPFLKSMKKKGIQRILLSFGNPSWQKRKVDYSEVGYYLDEAIYTRKEISKSQFVRSLSRRFQELVMVDNDPRELDSAVEVCPDLRTFWICRPLEGKEARYPEASRYVEMKPIHSHPRISSLEEISL